jgi:hypothetical protein
VVVVVGTLQLPRRASPAALRAAAMSAHELGDAVAFDSRLGAVESENSLLTGASLRQ